ncbi:hypothetical protein W03_16590 [Nitrosomonas sp. PY1]|uniref:hypothetical protein n=1 Tax=Nitrosomonas sp. PY1 TaxID=1803906 RepID=UPI001FC83E01|nr:hypothetical protein [Nitrosomonas sp. PY1]GKS69655.1 hypothetical protein W03_16590 [Nitrosomonas sp. PY1]
MNGCAITSNNEKLNNKIAYEGWYGLGLGITPSSGIAIQYEFLSNVQQEITLTAKELTGIILETLQQSNSTQDLQEQNIYSIEDSVNKWTVSSIYHDTITTDWKSIKGRKAGVLWWTKEYECQVSHKITINKSLKSPDQSLNYKIATIVRERPNDNYSWKLANPELGRLSYENLKNKIISAVNSEVKKRRDPRGNL